MRWGFLLILLLFFIGLSGQHLYQKPKPCVDKSILDAIIGEISNKPLERPLRILWVYGYDEHHIAGAHDYVKVKDLFVELLTSIKNVSVEAVFHFPSKTQFENTDLIIMYLHLPKLKKRQFKNFKNYIENGGGVVSLHETAILRPSRKGKSLSKCLGMAWNDDKSKWGAIFDDIKVDNQHDIFKGFPGKIKINDEFYWDLFQQKEVEILGTVRTGPDEDSMGPVPDSLLSKKASPMFWTYQIGQGKVFGTTTGHHTFTYYDPEFRIILFRAMAWTVGMEPDALMPLVFQGITSEDFKVGIITDMRYWKGKRRPK